ncbi:hypothetical protein KNLIENLN_00095 [Sinorhizobium phage NV1.1.1]|nr:hypothetical protein KNLIENLN_00095 [Sinorhizobium phage NV1.1.1]
MGKYQDDMAAGLVLLWLACIPIAYGFFGVRFASPNIAEGAEWILAIPAAIFWPVSLLIWLGAWLA